MAYFGPVSQSSIDKASHRFRWFITIAFTAMFASTISMSLYPHSWFWTGNKLWALGSSLTALSVIHNRYFDIKKCANPRNDRIDGLNGGKIKPFFKFIESALNHAWVLGFLLIGCSRWAKI